MMCITIFEGRNFYHNFKIVSFFSLKNSLYYIKLCTIDFLTVGLYGISIEIN